MTLQDLLRNVRNYTLLEEKAYCLFNCQDFYIHTFCFVADNKLRFLITKKDSLATNTLEIIAKNNGSFFHWQGETSWLYYYYEQLPNVCTYLIYMYLFSCIIKINESKNRR